MKLKLDEAGKPVFKDNLPIYIFADGSENTFDAAHAIKKIGELNTESKGHRLKFEEAETKLKAFEGIDPGKAKEAIGKMATVDLTKLVGLDKLEEVKAEVKKTMQAEIDTGKARVTELEGQLRGEVIGGQFARSEYFAKKTNMAPEIAQAVFGPNFKIEDGKLRAYDASGNLLYSKTKAGEPAEFEEAAELLVSNHPRRDTILKSAQKPGSGGQHQGGQGNQGGDGKVSMTRTEFDAKTPAEKSQIMAEKKTAIVDG